MGRHVYRGDWGFQRTEHGGLLPTGSKKRGVLGMGSIPIAILPSCQDMTTINIRNT